MECTQAQELFHPHLDGTLTGSLAAEFAAHQLQCAACRRELALLEVSGHVMAADSADPTPDADFTDRLMACALPPPAPWYRRRGVLLKLGAPLAAAASIALLLTFGGGSDGSSSGSVAPEHSHPAPVVLGEEGGETIANASELRARVKRARDLHPEREDLKALDEALEALVNQVSTDAEEGAAILETYGKMTIMEILELMQRDSSWREIPAGRAPNTSEGAHDPAVEEL
jgi:hypothetical protein